jgi:hypothetical protein
LYADAELCNQVSQITFATINRLLRMSAASTAVDAAVVVTLQHHTVH